MAFDFDTPIERRGSWSLRWDRYRERDVIPLWVADTDFRAPPCVLDALRERIEHGVLGYTVAPDALREAIVERMQRLYRWRIEPGWIVFLPGVVPGLHMAVRELVAADAHVLFPQPVYQHFGHAAQKAPRASDPVPLRLAENRWVWDEDRLAALTRPHTRLLMLCNPQNPGGTAYTRAELLRLAAHAERHDLIVCADEIHADLVLEQGASHLPIASLAPEVSRRTVTLMSPNKSFNFPGAGCAWAIIEDANLRRRFGADLHATVHDPTLFGYVAALAAYAQGGAWLAAQLEYLRANLALVAQAVAATPGLAMARMQAGYLAWIDASALGVADLHAHFLAHGLALSPGTQFGAAGFVRLNFGTRRELLRAALERLRRAAGSPR